MNYSHNKVSDIQIAYIGGGSRGWAWSLMTDLAMDDSVSGTVRLYDIDQQQMALCRLPHSGGDS